MKLITFDAESLPSERKGDAFIAFSRTSANCISKAAVSRTGYGGGDFIAIHQDEDIPEDWYMSAAAGGFKLRDDKGTGTLFFNNATLSNTILDALEIPDNRAAFKIGAEAIDIEGVAFWPIITAKPMISKRKKK